MPTFVQIMQAVSLSATAAFFAVFLYGVVRYGPHIADNIKLRADADVKLATALQGLQDELRYSRESCAKAQEEMEACTLGTEERLGKQIEDLKRVCVNALKAAEEINTRHQEHARVAAERHQETVKLAAELKEIVNNTLHAVNEIKTRQQFGQV